MNTITTATMSISSRLRSSPTIITHNDVDIDVGGTSRKGFLKEVTGQELIERFGEPICGSADKVDFSWHISIDGVVITIYVFKNYGCLAFDEISHWHVGGKISDAKVVVVEKLTMLGFKFTNKPW